ncbi:MAG: hypothetical protein ABGY24_12620 [bacterium]
MPGALANPGTKTNETNEANAVTKVTKVTKRKIVSTLLDQRGRGFTVE